VSGRGTWTAWGAAWVLGGFAAGCAPDKGASELHAAQVLLERDVKGLRESVAKLEVGSLAITEHMIWLGADVALGMAPEAPKP
jgi:hypothetical protein